MSMSGTIDQVTQRDKDELIFMAVLGISSTFTGESLVDHEHTESIIAGKCLEIDVDAHWRVCA